MEGHFVLLHSPVSLYHSCTPACVQDRSQGLEQNSEEQSEAFPHLSTIISFAFCKHGCIYLYVFPSGSYSKESACSAGDLDSIPVLGRFPWRRKWQPTPVSMPGKFHGDRSLAGYSHGVAKSQTRFTTTNNSLLFMCVNMHLCFCMCMCSCMSSSFI